MSMRLDFFVKWKHQSSIIFIGIDTLVLNILCISHFLPSITMTHEVAICVTYVA